MRVTLGLSPGSRHIGIAILHEDELIAWRVQTFFGKWSDKKQREILQSLRLLFASYSIEAVAVKIPDEFPKALPYSQLIGLLNRHCESYGMKARYYKLSDIKQYFSENPKVNKQAIIAFLAHRYPELQRDYRRGQVTGGQYFSRVFEAVAAALYTQGE